MKRTGTDARRQDSPRQFYPIFIHETDQGPVFHSVGESFFGSDRGEVVTPEGCVAVWPLRKDGSEGRWQVSAASLRKLIDQGFVRIGRWNASRTALSYLAEGEKTKVEEGKFPVIGRASDGSIIVDESGYQPELVPGTVWQIPSHNARKGTNLLKAIIPDSKFPYPKSLYAVEDALRFFVRNKPEATVLDFFAGSGTSAHAVMCLNREDGGRRRSISVTNNEVSEEERKELRKAGHRPGDPGWEQLGICEHITKPRISAAISGRTPEGAPIKGEYKHNENFLISEGLEENAVFFNLTYEDPLLVRHDRQFSRIAPLLWLRAGSQGRIITESDMHRGWDIAETYAVLENLDGMAPFLEALVGREGISMVFVITDDNTAFEMVSQQVPPGIVTGQLYRSYLHNFQFNSF